MQSHEDIKQEDIKQEDIKQIAIEEKHKASELSVGMAGAAAVLFLLLRIMAVADWDWYVAGMIIDSINFNDTIGVILGTLFSRPTLMSVGVLVLAPLSVINLIWKIKDGQIPSFGLILLILFFGTAVVSITATLHNWWLPVGIVIISFLLLMLRIYWHQGTGQRIFLGMFRATKMLAVAWLFLFAVLIETPWMEQEHIETDNGSVKGYVLQITPGFLKVLSDKPRQVTYIPLKSIRSRTIVE